MSSNEDTHLSKVGLSEAILTELRLLRMNQADLSKAVAVVNDRINSLSVTSGLSEGLTGAKPDSQDQPEKMVEHLLQQSKESDHSRSSLGNVAADGANPDDRPASSASSRKPNAISRIILTTYPGQSGINPISVNWGHRDPLSRGPVVVSRNQSTVRRRNAIGAHGGSYAIYHALAVASSEIKIDHMPDFTNTEPAVSIGPHPQWADIKKIVAMDPLGHLAPWIFKDMIRDEHVDIRPTIAVTKAHMKLPELEQSVRNGRLIPDGKICLNATGELAVTKFAVEPVWYLPGVAERFGI
ncbi:MAG: hypothetical protein M1817_006526, partial [Caeruleum heppii]